MDKYDVLIKWNEEDNCFIAVIPEVKHLRAFGETRAEALKQLGILVATHPEFLEVKKKSVRPN